MRSKCCTVLWILLITISAHAAATDRKLSLKNQHLLREFQFDGHAWRTTRIARLDGSASLAIQSDELLILNLNNTVLTIGDYQADADPMLATDPLTKEQSLTVGYTLNPGGNFRGPVPSKLWIRYW